MKRILHLLILLPLLFLGISEGISQQNPYSARPGWDIGFGFGGSYQQSDIRNSSGAGLTFIIGHSIYQKPGAIFGLDWRFRFLGGQNTAFDDRMTLDSMYNNVEYTHFNYDLELVLTLNRLRERTRVIVSGFGGAGVTHNLTNFDNSIDGAAYDYSTINPDGDASRYAIRNDLQTMSDGTFETVGIDNFCFAPTLGVFLGYQVTPRFSIGMEHKINYFLEENKSDIGANIDGIIGANSPIDKNHYTGLAFKWDIGGGSNHVDVPCEDPVISVTVIEVKSSYASHELSGTITNMTNDANIYVSIDGTPDNNFYFDKSTNRISSSFFLAPGAHTIKISARNNCGEDVETVQVNVQAPCKPPVVEFYVGGSMDNNYTHSLTGNVTNIFNKNEIGILVDNSPDNLFQFDPETNSISSNYNLNPGTHTITVNVINDCGRDTQTAEVIVEGPCEDPVINFSVSESNLDNITHQLSGTVTNINNRNNISILVDDAPDTNFHYEPGTNQISSSYNFEPGNHTVVITAKNECGEDTKRTQVVVEKPCDLPVITLSVIESENPNFTHELSGKINFVTNKNNITVLIDGVANNSFNFNTTTNGISSSYKFEPGDHKITVIAKNECGEDTEVAQVSAADPCKSPIVKFTVKAVKGASVSYQLTGNVANVEDKRDIVLSVDGNSNYSFDFSIRTNAISARFELGEGTHTIVVSAKNECGEDSESTEVIVGVPCETPTVAVSVSEINEGNFTHKLAGNITNLSNRNQITVMIDGAPDDSFDFSPSTNVLSAKYQFEPGQHTIVVTAKNECGEDINRVQFDVEEPCEDPEVKFTVKATKGASVKHLLTGTITNVEDKKDIILLVNGNSNYPFTFEPSTNTITASFQLTPGTYTISVKAKNDCNEDIESTEIVVQEPCNEPIVKMSVSESNLSNYTHQLTGNVANVASKNEITISLDGNSTPFVFSSRTNAISANFNLNPGTHTIVVTAKNECGEDSETTEIGVDVPCEDPVVVISVSEIDEDNFTHKLTGNITNVGNRNQINVSIDGNTNNSFDFNPSTNELIAKYNFEPGQHTIVVTAKNECDEDIERIQFNIESPCDPPIVKLSVTESNLTNYTHQLTGNVANVANKNEITISVDGNAIEFVFSTSTNTISANFNLSPGNHTIVVTAKTECGEDSESTEIGVDVPCEDPVLVISVSEINEANFTHQLTGNISNITNRNQISVSVDGNINNSFDFIPSTHELIAKYNFKSGQHTIIVTAKNDCGEDIERVQFSIEEPCKDPVVKVSIQATRQVENTFELTGKITSIDNKNDIKITVDGVVDNSFVFTASTGIISDTYQFESGTHTVVVYAKNDCGEHSQTLEVNVEDPCNPPVVKFSVKENITKSFTHKLTGNVSNIDNKENITILVNNEQQEILDFSPSTGAISLNFYFTPGTYTISVTARNECGEDTESTEITIEDPCDPPVASCTVSELDNDEFTHILKGDIININSRNNITVTIDGNANNSFQFDAATNKITGKYNFESGTHTILVTVRNDCGQDTEKVQFVVEKPCVAPVLNFNVSETNRSDYTHQLIGSVTNIDNRSQISVKLDGATDNGFQFNASTGKISSNYTLTPGTHTFVVTAKNECGEDTKTTEVEVEEPCSPPTVDLSVIESNSNSYTHQLSAHITNVERNEITITVDGNIDNAFNFVSSTGTVTNNYMLAPGTHNIVLTATNECGTDSETKNIVIEEPCYEPVINCTVSESDDFIYTNEISGTITNVERNDISIKIDNLPYISFDFNESTGSISEEYNLVPGNHTLVITAVNDCGADSETFNYTVASPCIPPVVFLSVSESNDDNFTHEIQSTVTNCNRNEITVSIDGSPTDNFEFNSSMNRVTGKYNLSPGSHTISVKAQNACGEDQKSTSVTVQEPCSPPVINISVSESNQSNSTHSLTGAITNIDNKNNITVWVDGSKDLSFNYNYSTDQISSSYDFSPGNHSFTVTAKNDCGEDSQSTSVTVENPCIPPVVSFTITESEDSDYTHKIFGTVTNIDSRSQITVRINGTIDNSFEFSSNNGQISDKYNFASGTTSIVVSVTNECGQDTETKQVTIVEEPCGPRINPGNAEWQFCLVTPSGTYNRTDLEDDNFTYSGNASSLFFKATAGGGDAIVGGNSYSVISGKYYLFTGQLIVTVSNNNPGSMGIWSVCIESEKAPQSGIGNGQPTSPCQETDGKGTETEGGSKGRTGGSDNIDVNNNKGRTGGSSNTNSNKGRTGGSSSSSSRTPSSGRTN